jgi:hypothetical protein
MHRMLLHSLYACGFILRTYSDISIRKFIQLNFAWEMPRVIMVVANDTLDICKTGGFHGGDYEEWCILGC